ncbi:hypothetical protein [Demequina sp. NBRC 110056]|uniref:DUF6912 family protein n=1 Tax=Demequina sp. NBRC 110056 TaxID=1570345 RepID=UPI00117CA710|nr:hypothetical protein [Demequina sp. NBRC 110056]
MRVYVPVHPSDLAAAVTGQWEPASGYALTARLLDITAVEDEEELVEQVRDAAAADAVLELGASRRAVVVVDYPRQDVTPVTGAHPAAVTLEGRVDPGSVACAFVDEADGGEDAALAAKGDAEALARLEESDLLWYDASELAALDL